MFNLALAVVWMSLLESFTWRDFIVGFLVGTAITLLLRRAADSWPAGLPVRCPLALAVLLVVFVRELVVANIAILRLVLSSRPPRPGMVALPLKVREDAQIALLANLITLTPGTLSVEVAPARDYLYVHTLDIENPEEVKAGIKEAFEKWILRVAGQEGVA